MSPPARIACTPPPRPLAPSPPLDDAVPGPVTVPTTTRPKSRSRKLAATATEASVIMDQLARSAVSSGPRKSDIVGDARQDPDQFTSSAAAPASPPPSSSLTTPARASAKKRGQHGQRSANRTVVLTLSASTLPSSPMLLSQSQSQSPTTTTTSPSGSLTLSPAAALGGRDSSATSADHHGCDPGKTTSTLNAAQTPGASSPGSGAPRRRSRRRANSNKSTHSSSSSAGSALSPRGGLLSSGSSKRRPSWDFRLPSPITPLAPPPPPPIDPQLKYLLSAFVFPSPMPSLKDPLRIPNMVNVLKRRWVYHDPAPLDASSFSVMSWNVLAPTFERSRPNSAMSHSPPLSPTLSSSGTDLHASGWPSDYLSRRAGIATEILYYEPDIICLQECDPDDYADFFQPILGAAGYKGVYATKSAQDGCALFYRSDRFTLAGDYPSPTTLRYADVPLEGAALDTPHVWRSPRPADHVTRHKMFANLAQIVVLKNKRTGARVRVVNTHLLWQPEFYDAKLLQTAILLEHLVLADYAGRGLAGALGGESQYLDVPTIKEEDDGDDDLTTGADEGHLLAAGKAVSAPIPIPAVATVKSRKAAQAPTNRESDTACMATPNKSSPSGRNVASYLPSPESPSHHDNPFITVTRNRSHSPTTYPPSPPASSPPLHTITSSTPPPSPPSRPMYVAPPARRADSPSVPGLSRCSHPPMIPSSGASSTPLPTIICGDLNSLPNSSVLHLLLTGVIARSEFGDSHFGRFTAGDRFQHSLALRSAYQHSTLPYTHRVAHFSGMIDHLLYSAGAIKLMGILDSADPPGYLEGVRSMPARHLPSDHLPLLAVFKSAAGYK